jgi:hypothetical protein
MVGMVPPASNRAAAGCWSPARSASSACVMPSSSALTDAADDPVAYAQDLQRERCLLFVAMT